MSARSKLNVAYVQGSLVVAAIAGFATGLLEVFVYVAVVLIISCVASNEIRMSKQHCRS